MILSLLLDTDSYKFSHFSQYPPGTTAMFSYLESRGGDYDSTVFFGLQYYLREYLSRRVTMEDVNEASEFARAHGVPFNLEGWTYVAKDLEGRLPLRIRAVPEGSVIPTGNILMSVESTDPKVFWVVSYFETLLMRLWYSITVATRSYHCKKIILEYLEATADDPDAEISFKLHDFGGRGVTTQEAAMIGGAAHLVNFKGSDTVAGIYTANKYYNHEMAAYSIPAAEHSTMTMWGRAREADAYANMLEQYKDAPIFACVSDSYDIFNAVSSIWGGALRDKVIAYKGTLVIRPDSGDPATVVCEILQRLEERFGTTINSKGFKVLNHNVRVIQGDGINEKSLEEILKAVKKIGFSATNVAFGMGGGLVQQLDRDTCKFAFKCSWARVEGREVEVFKSPVGDASKRSKKGLLELEVVGTEVQTARRWEASDTLLRDVYLNGEILNEDNLDAIRARTERPYGRYRSRFSEATISKAG